MAIDARVAYDVWLQLIYDEELYRALVANTHRELAASRGFGEEQLAVLDALRAERGTRWNIENLRFRTALETGGTLVSYLPRTIKLLTNGDENWLQELSFEYLAYYKWHELGHHRFAECERFAEYTRERIMKRRITPRHFAVVLDFELAVIRLLKRTAGVPAERWATPVALDDGALEAAVIERGPVVELLELPVDIREWIESSDPLRGQVHERPLTLLMYVSSLRETHKIKSLGEGAKVVFESFDGRPLGEIAAALDDEYGIEWDELAALVRGWLDVRALAIRPATASTTA
jgi:hypothetical protein